MIIFKMVNKDLGFWKTAIDCKIEKPEPNPKKALWGDLD